MNLFDLIETWTTAFNPSINEIKKAEYRADICNTCEYKEEINSSILLYLTKEDIILNKYKCRKCSCLLSKKLFSYFKEACPMNKWDK